MGVVLRSQLCPDPPGGVIFIAIVKVLAPVYWGRAMSTGGDDCPGGSRLWAPETQGEPEGTPISLSSLFRL